MISERLEILSEVELLTKEDNKDKLRVYEYAKSLNMSSKEIITILKRLNVPVNNHMSVMENGSVNKVEQFLRTLNQMLQSSGTRAPAAARFQPER